MNDTLFRIMKAILAFFLVLSQCLLLTGCWDNKELNQLAIIVGAAIDKEKNNKIKLTVQVFLPQSQSGGQQSSSGKAQVEIKSAVGTNMADAASNLQREYSRRLFWGHCKTYIFGQSLSEKGNLGRQIDFIDRHPEPREDSRLYVSDGKASDILQLSPSLEKYVGDVLRKMSEMHVGANITLKDFELMVTSEGGGALLPLIKIKHQNNDDRKMNVSPIIGGTAIFMRDKMIGRINEVESKGLLWVRNQNELPEITGYPKKGQTISLYLKRTKTNLIPKIEKGKWSVTIYISKEGMIVQNGSKINIMSKKNTKRVENYIEKDVSNSIEKALKQVKDGIKVDPFGFATAFHRKYPKEWEKVKDHWEVVLPDIYVETKVKVHVLEPGLSTTTLE
ncbi:Ger(x)C family spore germination protein [Neobacillus sp. NPDC058068]|uniref:Ger(x)C family spore germination protein n=1 Tax=Neobacillus sp. NPDC058068 TaxID=3346325 RepID=UPI0036D8DFA5